MSKFSYLNVFGGTFFIAVSISINEPVLAQILAPRFFTQQIPTIPQNPQIPSLLEEPQQELQSPSLMPTLEIPKANREKIKVERFIGIKTPIEIME